jgi:hypothetical protein
MRSRTRFDRLPQPVQRQAAKAVRLWRQDARHPGLALKRVHATRPIYSVRIARGYPALGLRDGDLVTGFRIGSDADYDKLLT